jgi:hypothetical protein
MLRAIVAAVLLLAAAAAAAEPVLTDEPSGPAAVLSKLYRFHFAHGQTFEVTYRKQRALFAPSLIAAFTAADRYAAAHPDEAPSLDGDPLTDSQEPAEAYTVGATTREGSDAIVAVDVRLDEATTRHLRVRLAPSGPTWRISNVLYAEGSDLVKILRTHD